MVKDSDPPRRSQPLIDVLKTIKALKQSPLWREQQARSAKLREGLALPPALAEALREAKAEAESVLPAPEPAPENTPEATMKPAAPAVEPAVPQAASKRKPGPRRIEWPHLPEALEALGQKWPNMTEVEAKHIEFVIKHLRQKGDDLAYELTEAGDKDERQRRTVRRRIEEWLETRRGNLSR